jgi:transcriptional regulator with XRE-family HTH domain
MDPNTPGDRIRNVRKRRGLTQRELAGKAGVALATVKKIEQGTYGALRSAMARKLAVALDVPTSALLTEPDAPVPSPESIQRWEPVRLALEGVHGGQPHDAPTLEEVRADFAGVTPLLTGGRFAEMGAVLPSLLRDADALVATSVNGTQAAARALRSQIRQASGALMLHAWQFSTADRAFDLAMEDADGDPLLQMSVVDERCWGLIRQGELTQARELASGWAVRNEPRMSASGTDHMAYWGRLLVRASAAAIRDNRPDEAAQALKLCRMAAVSTGDVRVLSRSWHGFGPAAVSVAAAECAMIQDRPERVLAITRRLDARRLPNTPAYRLDVANAHASLRHDSEAVAVLQELRRTRPQWFPQQRYAADIVQKLIDQRRTLSAEMRELAEAVRLPL